MQCALDMLKADGVVLMTRYDSDYHYLGHQDFISIWDFLNARRAGYSASHAPSRRAWINRTLPLPAFNYTHETGKTAIGLITSNMLRDHASTLSR